MCRRRRWLSSPPVPTIGARTRSTSGLPRIRVSDGPHGLRVQDDDNPDHLGLGRSLPATCFPPAVTLASSWDPQLIRIVGAALAREARSLGVDVVLGQGIEIKRSPLCGRNFEYYSEDPLQRHPVPRLPDLHRGGRGALRQVKQVGSGVLHRRQILT
jgi:beta-glucosidase-like glycosyl hydrolase